MSSKILMLRHGITEGNKNKWFYGELDLPLLEEGKASLREKKDQGFYPELPASSNVQFFTTGLVRTKETLDIIFGNQDDLEIPDLREMSFGIFEAKTFDELKKEPVFQEWLQDETGELVLPEGESRNQFTERVFRGTEELFKLHSRKESEVRQGADEEDVMSVLVCHGGVICAIMEKIFPNEKHDMWEWMIEPGSGYIVEMGEDGPTRYVQIGNTMVYY